VLGAVAVGGFAREEEDVVAQGANGRYNLNPWLTFIDP